MLRQWGCGYLPTGILLQLIESTESERAGRAGGHTGWNPAAFEFVPAEVAFDQLKKLPFAQWSLRANPVNCAPW